MREYLGTLKYLLRNLDKTTLTVLQSSYRIFILSDYPVGIQICFFVIFSNLKGKKLSCWDFLSAPTCFLNKQEQHSYVSVMKENNIFCRYRIVLKNYLGGTWQWSAREEMFLWKSKRMSCELFWYHFLNLPKPQGKKVVLLRSPFSSRLVFLNKYEQHSYVSVMIEPTSLQI